MRRTCRKSLNKLLRSSGGKLPLAQCNSEIAILDYTGHSIDRDRCLSDQVGRCEEGAMKGKSLQTHLDSVRDDAVDGNKEKVGLIISLKV